MVLPAVLLALLLSHLSPARAHPPAPGPWLAPRAPARRASPPPAGFYDPRANGGGWLTIVPDTYPVGMGEPINIVLSADSDAAVLKDQETSGGFRTWMLSLGGYAGECLGQHEGAHQGADLGDGRGPVNETAVLRWDYGDPQLGTCTESVKGGDHVRYWIQSGSKADSNAIFMAASYEKPIAEGHDIIINGYNLGRDYLIGNATNGAVSTLTLQNGTTASGSTSYGGWTYGNSVLYSAGYLSNSSIGVNHNGSVGVNNASAVDGLVAVITVHITSTPPGQDAKSSGAARRAPWTSSSPSALALAPLLGAALCVGGAWIGL